MLSESAKSKITPYIFFGLFLFINLYFGSYEDMREYMIAGALILGFT